MRVSLADSDSERQQGLSGRDFLAEDEGMLFVFEEPGRHGFWMNGMKFPLDFIWISGDRVVGTTETAPVTQMDIKPPQSIDRVLEVNSGFVARNKIKIGDKVSYEPVSN